MSIEKWVKQNKQEGNFQECVVYANIGNNSDELIVCEPEEADKAGCTIIDVTIINHNAFYRVAVVTAEVV